MCECTCDWMSICESIDKQTENQEMIISLLQDLRRELRRQNRTPQSSKRVSLDLDISPASPPLRTADLSREKT